MDKSKLQKILNALPDMYLVLDGEGVVLGFKPAVTTRPSPPPEKVLGKPLAEVLTPQIAKEAIDHIQRVLKNGEELQMSYSLAGEGEMEHFEARFTRIGESEVLAMVQDVTEHRRSDESLRALINATTDMAILLDIDGRILAINARAASAYGKRVDQAVGTSYWELLSPEVAKVRKRRLANVFRTGETTQVVDISGDLTFEINARPLTGAEDRVTSVAFFIRDITEKVKADNDLIESEGRYRQLFEENPIPMYIYDMDTLAILDVNRVMVENYGYTRDEMTAMTIKEIRPAEDVEALLENVTDLSTGQTYLGQWRHLKKDGSLIDVEVTSSNFPYQDLRARLVLCNDVTEKVQYRSQLEESEEQFRTAFFMSPDSINIHRLEDGVFMDVNQTFTELTGYSREETIGKTYEEINLWHDLNDRQRFIEGLEEKGQVENLEAEFVMKDGTVRYGYISAKIVQLKGEPHILSITRDWTSLAEARLALEESEWKFRSIVESSPMGMHLYQLDEDNRLIFTGANPAADTMLGVDNSQFVGMTLEEAFPPLADTEIPERYREVCSTGESWHTEQIDYKDEQIQGAFGVHAFCTVPGTMAVMFLDITERKIAAQTLAESEEKFRQAFHTSPDPMIINRTDNSIILDVNDGFVNAIGYSREESVGRTPAELGLWLDDGFRELAATKLRAEGKMHNVEANIQTKNGGIRTVLFSGTVFTLGSESRMLTVSRDITDLKDARDALLESEAKFRQAFHTSPDPMVISRLDDGVILDVNDGFLSTLGYSREESIGRTTKELGMWFKSELRDRAVEKLKEKGRFQNLEVNLRARNGDVKTILISGTLITLANEPVMLTIARDITELKDARDALLESEEWFRTVFQTSPDSILIVDPQEQIIVDVNEGFVNSSGYSREEVVGGSSLELGIWDDPGDRDRFYEAIYEAGTIDGFELDFRRKDGSVGKGFLSAKILQHHGRPGILINVRDITSLMEAQAQLKDSLSEKEILLKEIHHRVKNNLQVISGLLNLQAHHIDDPMSREIYKESQNRVITMALIHEELYQSENLGQVQFGDYIGNLCNNLMVSYGADRKRIDLKMDAVQSELVVDTVIPCGLIINELVTNSLKHAFPGEREGVITVTFRTLPDEQFQLTVSDNGVGIPEDVDINSTPTLGMQLVTVLVQQLGGTLEVGGETGTIFTITFKEYHEAGTVLY